MLRSPYPHSPDTCKSCSYTDVDLFGTHTRTVLFILSFCAQIKAIGSALYVRIDAALAARKKAFCCSEGLSHLR